MNAERTCREADARLTKAQDAVYANLTDCYADDGGASVWAELYAALSAVQEAKRAMDAERAYETASVRYVEASDEVDALEPWEPIEWCEEVWTLYHEAICGYFEAKRALYPDYQVVSVVLPLHLIDDTSDGALCGAATRDTLHVSRYARLDALNVKFCDECVALARTDG